MFKLPSRIRDLSFFDRLVIATILGALVLATILVVQGDRIPFKVKDFSWENRKIGVRDRYFTLTFNRPVDRATVERDLVIDPALKGVMAWSGEKMTYTLTELPIYGKKYELQLQGSAPITPFIGQFYSHDRAFAYIGVEPAERGRLIICNIIQGANNVTELKKTILTPRDLIVTDFKIYPSGDKILFSAFDAATLGREIPKRQLYTVTTGLNRSDKDDNIPNGRLERVIDAKIYNNIRFDLSENGKTIVVQRVNHKNPGDAGLWTIDGTGQARPLGINSDTFTISPDGERMYAAGSGGLASVPLTPTAGGAEFLEGYESILGFSRSGSRQLFVKITPNGNRVLMLRDDREPEREKPLFISTKPIIDCAFEPREEKFLYCLKRDLMQLETGQIAETSFISIVDIEKAREVPILNLPNYRDVQLSMSPDGIALLFDQLVIKPGGLKDLVTSEGAIIAGGGLWLFTLPDNPDIDAPPKILPEELNPGFKPRWFP